MFGKSKGKKYKNKNIADIIYTVKAVSPEKKLIELKSDDGSENIVITYKELKDRYEEV